MAIIRQPRPARYSNINQDVIEDERLSHKALGVLVYILSKPDNWVTKTNQLCSRFHCGRTAILAILNEIEEIGYLQRVRYKDDKGLFQWNILIGDTPIKSAPSIAQVSIVGKPAYGKPAGRKPDYITNTDSTKTELTITESSSGGRSETFERKETLDPFWRGAAKQVAREVIREQRGSAAVPNFMTDAPWGQLAQDLDLPPAVVFSHFRTYLENLSSVTGKRDPISYAGAIINDLYKTPGKELACKPWIQFEEHYRQYREAPDVGFADTDLGQDYQRFKNVLDQLED